MNYTHLCKMQALLPKRLLMKAAANEGRSALKCISAEQLS